MQLLVPLLHSNICFTLVGISNTYLQCGMWSFLNIILSSFPGMSTGNGSRVVQVLRLSWITRGGTREVNTLNCFVSIVLLPRYCWLHCAYCTVIQRLGVCCDIWSFCLSGWWPSFLHNVITYLSHSPLCPAGPLLFPRFTRSHGHLKDLAVMAAKEEKTLEGWRENAAGTGEHL